mmetsp:Transcript_40705/g.56706  ORF Transcript_40705/g.56706 Transcript_40705/m.56706 type:complete len:83 (+) Transcript_40705:337-585(+)
MRKCKASFFGFLHQPGPQPVEFVKLARGAGAIDAALLCGDALAKPTVRRESLGAVADKVKPLKQAPNSSGKFSVRSAPGFQY